MIAYSHYNFRRLRRAKYVQIAKTVAAIAVAAAAGIIFFF